MRLLYSYKMLQECLLALDIALRDLPNTSFPIELGEAIDLMYTTDLLRNVPGHHDRSETVQVVHTELFDDSCDQASGDLLRLRSQRYLSMSYSNRIKSLVSVVLPAHIQQSQMLSIGE